MHRRLVGLIIDIDHTGIKALLHAVGEHGAVKIVTAVAQIDALEAIIGLL